MVPRDVTKQRTAKRHKVITFIWYKIVGSSAVQAGESCEGLARSCDISSEGIGLITAQALPLGALLFVEIVVPQGNLSVLATVMYCGEETDGMYRVGMQLDVVPPNDRPTLARMVAQ